MYDSRRMVDLGKSNQPHRLVAWRGDRGSRHDRESPSRDPMCSRRPPFTKSTVGDLIVTDLLLGDKARFPGCHCLKRAKRLYRCTVQVLLTSPESPLLYGGLH